MTMSSYDINENKDTHSGFDLRPNVQRQRNIKTAF